MDLADEVMALLFNMLSRLVITFLPKSKRFLILLLQSPSAVILEPQTIKSPTVSPSICHEVLEPDAMILVFWMLSTQTTALSNSMKLSHALWGHPRRTGHGGEVWQNVVHWRGEWQTTSVFLPWEPHFHSFFGNYHMWLIATLWDSTTLY